MLFTTNCYAITIQEAQQYITDKVILYPDGGGPGVIGIVEGIRSVNGFNFLFIRVPASKIEFIYDLKYIYKLEECND